MSWTRLLAAASALAATVILSSAHGAIIQFEAVADGLQETPPVATPGTGDAFLSINDATGDWTLNGNYTNLIGTVNNAHIHGPAPPGIAAVVIAGLTHTSGTSGTLTGAGTFTVAQMADLFAGLYYVNVHSTFRPLGEIRGQLQQVPEPGSLILLVTGGIALLAIARRAAKRPA